MTVAESSKGHLRNRSSTFRFDSWGSHINHHTYSTSTTNNVPDVDRIKFQSFKFPTSSCTMRSYSIHHDKAGLFSLPLPPSTPGTANIDIESYPGFEINDQPVVDDMESSLHGHHHSRSADVQVIDLLPMDTLDETRSDVSVSPGPDDTITWAPYHWPSESSVAVSRGFGLRKSPYGGQYTARVSGFGDYFSFRYRRRVLLKRVPSAMLIRILRWGSWIAMVALLILALGFIIRFR